MIFYKSWAIFLLNLLIEWINPMLKQTIEYTSPLDAIVELAKRLQVYESRYGMSSESFFDQYHKGLLADDIAYVEWSNDYCHYLALRRELEDKLRHAA